MMTETLREVLKEEGMAAIVTSGEDFPHVVNTWNSYIILTKEDCILIPVGGMRNTEKNLKRDNRVLLTVGSRNVRGLRYIGTGFLIEGTAELEESGEHFDLVKQNYGWIRAALVVKPEKITQTL